MSVCANIYCLFKGERPGPERVKTLQSLIWNRLGYGECYVPHNEEYGVLVEWEYADLEMSISSDYRLEQLPRPRHAPLSNVPSIDGRLYGIHYLTRWWDEGSPRGAHAGVRDHDADTPGAARYRSRMV